MNTRMLKSLSLLIALTLLSACADNIGFQVAGDSEVFKQNEENYSKQLDIMMVVDNSGSMATSQKNFAANISAFVDTFANRGLDYRIVVVTTDAWTDYFTPGTRAYNEIPVGNNSLFKNGSPLAGPSGYPVITNQTPNVKEALLKNALQGVAGTGDERPLMSIRAALSNPANVSFLRPDAFLAVVVLTDEDDFSYKGYQNKDNLYDDPALEKPEEFLTYLDGLTRGQSRLKRFSFNVMGIDDPICAESLHIPGSNKHKVAKRLIEVAKKSGGEVGSICGDFGEHMGRMSGKILELITRFPLSRIPDVSTVKIEVDGQIVKQNPNHGWTYDNVENTIVFHGDSIPNAGAVVRIDFTPTTSR